MLEGMVQLDRKEIVVRMVLCEASCPGFSACVESGALSCWRCGWGDLAQRLAMVREWKEKKKEGGKEGE